MPRDEESGRIFSLGTGLGAWADSVSLTHLSERNGEVLCATNPGTELSPLVPRIFRDSEFLSPVMIYGQEISLAHLRASSAAGLHCFCIAEEKQATGVYRQCILMEVGEDYSISLHPHDSTRIAILRIRWNSRHQVFTLENAVGGTLVYRPNRFGGLEMVQCGGLPVDIQRQFGDFSFANCAELLQAWLEPYSEKLGYDLWRMHWRSFSAEGSVEAPG